MNAREKGGNTHSTNHEPKSWTVDECCALFGPDTTKQLARKLKRSDKSVRIHRGEFVPGYVAWLKEKGYVYNVNRMLVKQFLMELEP